VDIGKVELACGSGCPGPRSDGRVIAENWVNMGVRL